MRCNRIMAQFKPTSLGGCALWLKADAGIVTVDGKVSAWADQSGNGRHATQSTSADYRPLYVASAQGNRPTLRFDGSNDYLNTVAANTFASVAFTWFFVTSPTKNANSQSMFSYHTDGGGGASIGLDDSSTGYVKFHVDSYNNTKVLSSGSILNVASILTGKLDSAITLYRNGALQNQRTGTLIHTIPNTVAQIAKWPGGSQYFGGDISEIIIFNRALTDAERQTIERHLSGKYNITLAA